MDLKRSDFLPPYDSAGIESIITEIGDLYNKLSAVLQSHTDEYPDSTKVCLTYFHHCITRNRRYINRYHQLLEYLH